ncbi:hypothetical protein [Streptomyces sp. NPDC002537]
MLEFKNRFKDKVKVHCYLSAAGLPEEMVTWGDSLESGKTFIQPALFSAWVEDGLLYIRNTYSIPGSTYKNYTIELFSDGETEKLDGKLSIPNSNHTYAVKVADGASEHTLQQLLEEKGWRTVVKITPLQGDISDERYDAQHFTVSQVNTGTPDLEPEPEDEARKQISSGEIELEPQSDDTSEVEYEGSREEIPEILRKEPVKDSTGKWVEFKEGERVPTDIGEQYDRFTTWLGEPGRSGVLYRPTQVSIEEKLEDGCLVVSCPENDDFSELELYLRVDSGMVPYAFPGPWCCKIPADGSKYTVKFKHHKLPGISMEDLLNGHRGALFLFQPIRGESQGYYKNSVLGESARVLGEGVTKSPKIRLIRGLDRGEYRVSWENGARKYTDRDETRWSRQDLFFKGNQSRIEEPRSGVTNLKDGRIVFRSEQNDTFTALVANVYVKPTSSHSEHFLVGGSARGISGEVVIPADGDEYAVEAIFGSNSKNIEDFLASDNCVVSIDIHPIEKGCPESEYPKSDYFRVSRAGVNSPISDDAGDNDQTEVEVIDSVSVSFPTEHPDRSDDAPEANYFLEKLDGFTSQGWAGKSVSVGEIATDKFQEALNFAEEAVKSRFADRNAELANQFVVNLRAGYEEAQPVFTKGKVASHLFNNGFAAWGMYAAFKPDSEVSELGKGSAFAGFASSSLGTMDDLLKAAKVSKAVGKAVGKAALVLGILSDGLSLADNINKGDRKAIAADTLALTGSILSLAFPPAILLSLPSIWLAIEGLIWDTIPTYEGLCEDLRKKILFVADDYASKVALLLEIQAVHTASLNKAIVAVHLEQNPDLKIGPNLKASIEFIEQPGLIEKIMKKVEKEVQAAIASGLLKPAVDSVKDGIENLDFAPSDEMMARFFNGPDDFRKMVLEWDRYLRNLKKDLEASRNIKNRLQRELEESCQDSELAIANMAAEQLRLRPESDISDAIKEYFYAKAIGYEESRKKNIEITLKHIKNDLPRIVKRLEEVEFLEEDLKDELEKIKGDSDDYYLSLLNPLAYLITQLVVKAAKPDFTTGQIKELYKGYVEFVSVEMAGHITAKGLAAWSENDHNDCFHQQTHHE